MHVLVCGLDHVMREVLRAMDSQHRRRVETILAYEEDTAGV